MLNLDTHIVVFALEQSLTAREDELLRNQEWAVSDMVFWEIAMLAKRKRIGFDLATPHARDFLRKCVVLPITGEIAMQSTQLDFRSDPADEIIAATSIVHKIPLLTRDKIIRKSKLVKFV